MDVPPVPPPPLHREGGQQPLQSTTTTSTTSSSSSWRSAFNSLNPSSILPPHLALGSGTAAKFSGIPPSSHMQDILKSQRPNPAPTPSRPTSSSTPKSRLPLAPRALVAPWTSTSTSTSDFVPYLAGQQQQQVAQGVQQQQQQVLLTPSPIKSDQSKLLQLPSSSSASSGRHSSRSKKSSSSRTGRPRKGSLSSASSSSSSSYSSSSSTASEAPSSSSSSKGHHHRSKSASGNSRSIGSNGSYVPPGAGHVAWKSLTRARGRVFFDSASYVLDQLSLQASSSTPSTTTPSSTPKPPVPHNTRALASLLPTVTSPSFSLRKLTKHSPAPRSKDGTAPPPPPPPAPRITPSPTSRKLMPPGHLASRSRSSSSSSSSSSSTSSYSGRNHPARTGRRGRPAQYFDSADWALHPSARPSMTRLHRPYSTTKSPSRLVTLS